MKLTHPFFIYRLFIVSFLCLAFSHVHANQLKGVRAWPSPDNTRIVLDLKSKPDYEVTYLKRPDRLVVDIKSATNIVDLKSIKHTGPLVKNIRESASNSKNTYRLVIDLKHASIANTFILPPAKPYGHRLVIDLPHQVTITPVKISLANKIPQVISAGRDVIIAIDAGHGGEDPGALGTFSYEKKITLEIAKRLQKRINQQMGMHAFLIRTGDYYVNLNKRSELAVNGKADFLVSIHADGFTSSQPSGASVWILSDRRANSEMGRRMERQEVHSELLGGKGEVTDSGSSVPFLNKVFFDMSKSNSMQVGSDIGHLVVTELKKITKLHKKRPVGASLAVLKSPYIPSILVEAGFITNHREERLLNQKEYQNKVANAVYEGIFKHFTESPPHDSLFAQKKRAIKHTVRSGESLSILGERYSVSRQQLTSYNHLTSSSLRIGQVLKIPPNYELVVKRDVTKPTILKPTLLKPLVHTVKRGEFLSAIANSYGKSTRVLKTYNQLSSTVLKVGQKIKIPADEPKVIAQTLKKSLKATVHKVRRGESLSVIAADYGKTLDELKKHNQLKSTSLLVGQKIKIPGDEPKVIAKTVKKALKATVHKVRSGESLSVIAAYYDKSTRELKKHNQLKSTSLLVGQKIKIPGDELTVIAKTVKKALKATVHKVRSGESLSVIAARYGKTTRELKNHNQLKSTSLLVGQKIKIPGDESTVIAKTVKKALKATVHKVRSGESLSVIAAYYGKTTRELKNHNQLKSTSLLVGQKVKIPADGQTITAKPTVHKVRSGESLSVIAAYYGKTTRELKNHNQLKSTSLLVGQKVKIPADRQTITAKPIVHKVRSGESLSVIAIWYGKTISELKKHNQLKSTSLVVGQKIKIPNGEQQVTVHPTNMSLKAIVHKVRSGESLSVIAARYDTSSSLLKYYNKLRSTSLSVGQKIKIPAGADKLTLHKVRSGESLSVIAKRYGTSPSVIKSINKLRSNSLAIGQLLTIPTT